MNAPRFGQAICSDLAQSGSREWLDTNGLGGWASSTVAGMNTRRYHGLLVAATQPPAGRAVLLSKFEETVIVNGRRFDLSVNRYPGAVHPQGHLHMAEFRLDPFPVFVYRAEGVEIEKRVFMVHGENTTVVEYALRTPGEVMLELRPLIAFRDYHSTTHANSALNPAVHTAEGRATVKPYADLPELHFQYTLANYEQTGHWYYRLEYDVERDRGLDFEEDLFNPFVLRFDLARPAAVIASLMPRDAADAVRLREAEIQRRAAESGLTAAADQFIVQRGKLKTIIAGYHWFGDWGRDSMIALPGLALVTGRLEEARDILKAFADSCSEGMLPNRFPDAGETPEYNTVDATLWFFEAIRSYLAYGGEEAFVRSHLYDLLLDIVGWHVRGTRYGIRMDSDGLLQCGVEGVQLTWMDAKIGDWVVTPRIGKPVEIQALWYNALEITAALARRFGDPAMEHSMSAMAANARASFDPLFWNEREGCFYDVVREGRGDPSIRPNQVFAVSLHHAIARGDHARSMIAVVERELLTPAGLRSLSPREPQYRGRYEGGVFERDSSYHQGTVWPWLLGPFLDAWLKVHGRGEPQMRRAQEWFDGLLRHFEASSVGQIPEIAGGDPPYPAKGCIAQAWSVAELLRTADLNQLVAPGLNGLGRRQ